VENLVFYFALIVHCFNNKT